MFAPSSQARLILATVSPLLVFAIGCDRGDHDRTTTVAARIAVDSTRHPSVTTATNAAPPAAAKPASYEDAESAYTAGHYDQAAELFAAYTEQKPENPWGFYMLGLSSWKSGNLAQADVAFDQALKLDPSHQKSLLNSSRVLMELGRTQEALERIQAALEHDSTSAEAWRVLGRAQTELGSTDEAIEAYRRAITLDDRDAWAMNNLGLIYIQRGCYEDALAPLARATQLKPNAPVFQNNLGQALEQSGHPAEAMAAYQAALAADSGYAKASLSLERVAKRGEDSTSSVIDLNAVGRDFQATIEQWRDEFARARAEDPNSGTADSVSSRSMTRDSTPEIVNQPDSAH